MAHRVTKIETPLSAMFYIVCGGALIGRDLAKRLQHLVVHRSTKQTPTRKNDRAKRLVNDKVIKQFKQFYRDHDFICLTFCGQTNYTGRSGRR